MDKYPCPCVEAGFRSLRQAQGRPSKPFLRSCRVGTAHQVPRRWAVPTLRDFAGATLVSPLFFARTEKGDTSVAPTGDRASLASKRKPPVFRPGVFGLVRNSVRPGGSRG